MYVCMYVRMYVLACLCALRVYGVWECLLSCVYKNNKRNTYNSFKTGHLYKFHIFTIHVATIHTKCDTNVSCTMQ